MHIYHADRAKTEGELYWPKVAEDIQRYPADCLDELARIKCER